MSTSIQSDGGRAESGMRETNDCVVCALSNASGIGYVKAHAILKANGRKDRRGTRSHITSAALKQGQSQGLWSFRELEIPRRSLTEAGLRYGMYRTTKPTVAAFIRTLPRTGRFILAAAHHAFCYIDGKIVESNYRPVTRGRMHWCYEIIPAAKAEKPSHLTPEQLKELWAMLEKTKQMMGVA
jgi:hypothetical protein